MGNIRQTHCINGHLLAGRNVYLQWRKGRGAPHRRCRACTLEQNKISRAYSDKPWANGKKQEKK